MSTIHSSLEQPLNSDPQVYKSLHQGYLPTYRCHKEVQAGMIEDITVNPDGSAYLRLNCLDTNVRLYVDDAYMAKHKPSPKGFYVLYEDGYESFSPAKAFVDGYRLAGPDLGQGRFLAVLGVMILLLIVSWLFAAPVKADGFPEVRVQVNGTKATVTWSAPTTREDGSALAGGDIAGYTVYYYRGDAPTDNEFEGKTLEVNRLATQAQVDIDQPGEWHFAVATTDTDGNISALSDHVSRTWTADQVKETSPPKSATGLDVSLQ